MAKRRRKKTNKKGSGRSAKEKKVKKQGSREKKEARKQDKEEAKRERKERKKEKAKPKYPIFTSRLKRWIGAVLLMVVGVIVLLSFFELAGRAGASVFKGIESLIGKTVFFIPVLFFCGAFLVIKPQKKRIVAPVFLALLLLTAGISGLLTVQDIEAGAGGWLGYVIGWPLLNYFGQLVARVVCSAFVLIGLLIFWEFLPKKKKEPKEIEEKEVKKEKELSKEQAAFAKASAPEEKPKFQIKPLDFLSKKKEAAVPAAKSSEFVSDSKAKPAEPVLDPAADYKRPGLELFDTSEEKALGGDTEQNAQTIQKTLLNFGISVEMAEFNVGPTVTQYTLKPAEGVKLSKITGLNNDLALSLAAHPIRIEAPIPGRSLVGIEVPNKQRALVKVGNLLGVSEFQSSNRPLVLALGKDVMGKPILPDLGAMPHFLVAGATGTGKTICLNSLLMSLIFRNSPKILRFILIDPKRVEFPVYAQLPHLLTPVIFNPQKAVNALNWLVGEMDRRFDILKEFGARDIGSFNKVIHVKSKKQEDFETMPYIVLVIDELADLMAAKGREVEAAIVRLSQLARAVGIHLIVATQRPSVEVITGLIKANITSRIAFQVASNVDSRTILDCAGAEKLLGRGDMLFLSSEFSRPKRIQGSFVSAPEIKKVVKFIVKENTAEAREEIIEEGEESAAQSAEVPNFAEEPEEPLYAEAKGVVIEYNKASASLLQRRLRIGYARAARILDLLESNGVVGPQEGAKPREVYIKTAQEQKDDGFVDAGEVEGEYK